MRVVFWMGYLLVAAALGRWWGGKDTPSTSVPIGATVADTLLGERRSSAGRAVSLKDHPCLSALVEDLPKLLRQAEERSLSGSSPETLLVAARWFQTDREGLLKHLVTSGRPQPLNAIVSRWIAFEDPEAAWENLLRNRDRWDRDLLDALAIVDPAKSSEIEDQSYRFRTIYKNWARLDPIGAENAVRESKHWQKRYAVEGIAERKALDLPFEEAFAWARDFEVLPESAMGTVIDHLAKTDLESALRHLSEAGLSKYHAMGYTRFALRQLPINEAVKLLECYPAKLSLFDSLEGLPRDPMETARLLSPVAKEIERVKLPTNWKPDSDDISGALSFLASEPDDPVRRALLESSLRYWNNDRQALVSDFIRNLPDPMTRSNYAQEFGGRDLGMVNLIDKTLLGDDLNGALIHSRVSEAIQSLTHMDPHRASAAAAAIDEPEWRGIAHRALFEGWAEHDEAAALEWALTLSHSERRVAELDEQIRNHGRPQP